MILFLVQAKIRMAVEVDFLNEVLYRDVLLQNTKTSKPGHTPPRTTPNQMESMQAGLVFLCWKTLFCIYSINVKPRNWCYFAT